MTQLFRDGGKMAVDDIETKKCGCLPKKKKKKESLFSKTGDELNWPPGLWFPGPVLGHYVLGPLVLWQ